MTNPTIIASDNISGEKRNMLEEVAREELQRSAPSSDFEPEPS